jgi:hypothetical protein
VLKLSTRDEVEEAAELAIGIAVARGKLYFEYEVFGIGGRTIRRPPISE